MFTFNLLYAVFIAAPAQAGGCSTDIELLQPGSSPEITIPELAVPAPDVIHAGQLLLDEDNWAITGAAGRGTRCP